MLNACENDLKNNKSFSPLAHQELFRAFHSATSNTRKYAIDLADLNLEIELKKEKKVLRGLIGLKNGIIGVVVISFFLALFMGQALSKSIVTPINRLRVATEEIAEGKFNPLVEIESKDEFGKLIESFSAMGREIKLNEEALKKSLVEKETLLKEVHHRTKNNMQIISSLLWLQSREIQEKEYLEMFEDCSNRINAMSLIHETIYKSADFSKINFNEFLLALFDSLFDTYGIQPERIRFVINSNNIFLDMDSSIPCGLLVQELISNAFKYAFPDNRQGTIRVSIHSPEKGLIELKVSDDGIGLPEGLDIRNTHSLGLRLVTTLVENQLGGTLELNREYGTEFKIKFSSKQEI